MGIAGYSVTGVPGAYLILSLFISQVLFSSVFTQRWPTPHFTGDQGVSRHADHRPEQDAAFHHRSYILRGVRSFVNYCIIEKVLYILLLVLQFITVFMAACCQGIFRPSPARITNGLVTMYQSRKCSRC